MPAGDAANARGVSLLLSSDDVNALPAQLNDMLDDLVLLPGKLAQYYLNNAQAVAAGAFTKLTGWTAIGSVNIAGFGTGTGTFTVPAGQGGTYRFSWGCAVAAAAGLTRAASALFVGGVQDFTQHGSPGGSTATDAGNGSWPLVLAAGATVDLRCFVAGAATTMYISGNNANRLTIERLG